MMMMMTMVNVCMLRTCEPVTYRSTFLLSKNHLTRNISWAYHNRLLKQRKEPNELEFEAVMCNLGVSNLGANFHFARLVWKVTSDEI